MADQGDVPGATLRTGHYAVVDGRTHPALVRLDLPYIALVLEGGEHQPGRLSHHAVPNWHERRRVPLADVERIFHVTTWAFYAGFIVNVDWVGSAEEVGFVWDPRGTWFPRPSPYTLPEQERFRYAQAGRSAPPGVRPIDKFGPYVGGAWTKDLLLVREVVDEVPLDFEAELRRQREESVTRRPRRRPQRAD